LDYDWLRFDAQAGRQEKGRDWTAAPAAKTVKGPAPAKPAAVKPATPPPDEEEEVHEEEDDQYSRMKKYYKK